MVTYIDGHEDRAGKQKMLTLKQKSYQVKSVYEKKSGSKEAKQQIVIVLG